MFTKNVFVKDDVNIKNKIYKWVLFIITFSVTVSFTVTVESVATKPTVVKIVKGL